MAFTPLAAPKTMGTGSSPGFQPMEIVDVDAMAPKKSAPFKLVPGKNETPSVPQDIATGVSQQQLKTIRGISQVPVAAANLIYKGINKVAGKEVIPEVQPFLGKDFDMSVLEAKNGWQKLGQFGESMFEFLLPASNINTAAKVAGAGASATAASLATKAGTSPAAINVIKGGANLATQSLIQGGTAGAITAAQTNKVGTEAKVNALISAAFPWIAAGAQRIAPKIMESVIKPTEADYKNGFKRETLSEFGIHGSMNSAKTKVETKLNGLTQQLNQRLKDSDAVVDVQGAMERTISRVTDYKSIQLGQAADRNAAIADLKNDMDDIIKLFDDAGTPLELNKVPIQIANDQIKRGAGTKGSWVYGKVPHDKAVDYVYSVFYNELKKEIEKVGPPGIKNLNAAMHKLIPVSAALTRAANRTSRNNIVSLSDAMFLLGSAFNPVSLAVYGPYYASRSGSFAGFLQSAQDSWMSAGAKAGIKALGSTSDRPQE